MNQEGLDEEAKAGSEILSWSNGTTETGTGGGPGKPGACRSIAARPCWDQTTLTPRCLGIADGMGPSSGRIAAPTVPGLVRGGVFSPPPEPTASCMSIPSAVAKAAVTMLVRQMDSRRRSTRSISSRRNAM